MSGARDLVLARVGTRSLHPQWIVGAEQRSWDLKLVPFEPLPPQHEQGCLPGDVVTGPKWSGLKHLLGTWDGWRDYEYVWLPDDDLLTDPDTITALFEAGRSAGLKLFAPALHDASYFAHFSVMRNRSFHGRRTGFVEIMMPAFEVKVLEELLWTLDLTETGWGWGLDSLWPALLGHEDVGVIDALPVLHTRPVGQMRDVDLGRRVLAESDEIMARYGCAQVHTTFGAFAEDGKPEEQDPARLLARLVAGWQHLVDHDPRVLQWIVEAQQGQWTCPDYPVAGTPNRVPLTGSA